METVIKCLVASLLQIVKNEKGKKNSDVGHEWFFGSERESK